MTALAPTLQAFFTGRLIRQRQASPSTIAAYRDTWRLLLGYCAARTGKQPWSTPGLVETRFSPDALVWVAVVFHGTAAWRNHGLIIFRSCLSNICPAALPSCPALVAGSARQAPAGGTRGISSSGTRCAPRVPRAGQRVTRSVIACDAGGALDLGGGSVAPVPRPARRCPPAAAPVLTCQAISEEGRGPGRSPGGCGQSPPGS
jgi:hypothetical protein